MFMSCEDVIRKLESDNWSCISKSVHEELEYIDAKQGDCEISVGFSQGSIWYILYIEKQGYWSSKNGN